MIGRVFRALHTIKGSGAMFGFDQMAAFTHDVENAFDLVRGGRLAVTPELIGITLAARDHIRVSAGGRRHGGGRGDSGAPAGIGRRRCQRDAARQQPGRHHAKPAAKPGRSGFISGRAETVF